MRIVAAFLVLLFTIPSQATAQRQSVDNAQAGLSGDVVQLASPDAEIERRLDLLFADIEGLQGLDSTVRGGVVTLTGVALNDGDKRKAEALATRLAGVVSVENNVRIERRVGRRLEPMVRKADGMLHEFIAFLPVMLIALLAFLAIWLSGRLLTRPGGLLGKVAPNPLVHTLIEQIARLAFILLGLVVAMRILGATALLGSILGAAGVVGLAVGFAVRDTIENYIASILLSIRRPFSPNDHVIIEGMEGRVTRLNSRATFLTSFDGSELRIPNAIVYKAKIRNFSQIPERRFDFTIGVGYENELHDVLAIARRAACLSKGVLSDPAPQVLLDGLDASTISVKVMGWVNLVHSDFAGVRSETIRSVKQAFDRHSISMPAPIQNIRMLAGEKPCSVPHREMTEREDRNDTSSDHAIEDKVSAIRRNSAEDLLTANAPKE